MHPYLKSQLTWSRELLLLHPLNLCREEEAETLIRSSYKYSSIISLNIRRMKTEVLCLEKDPWNCEVNLLFLESHRTSTGGTGGRLPGTFADTYSVTWICTKGFISYT